MKYFLFFFLLPIHLLLIAQNTYEVNVVLPAQNKEACKVTIKVPSVVEKTVVYFLPSSSSSDYLSAGFDNNIKNFKAIDKEGNELPYVLENSNIVKIKRANLLDKISYEVYAHTENEKGKTFYQPGSLIFERDLFLLNYNAMLGYLDGYAFRPYKVNIVNHQNLQSHSSLDYTLVDADTLQVKLGNYSQLFENPLLLANVDTATINYKGSEFKIAYLDKNKNYTINTIKEWLEPVVKAVGDFNDGFPIEKYQFTILLEDEVSDIGEDAEQFGGLHHQTSSLYILPKIRLRPKMQALLQRLTMHELLHLITPLALHGEDLAPPGVFSSANSKHLWLYEGVTEYFSLLLLYRNGLISERKFLNEISKKIFFTERFPKSSLTDMSENIDDSNYNYQFRNFYNKGAIIAFMLDIELRHLSRGKTGLENVILEMTKQPEKGIGFAEDGFFDWFNEVSTYNFSKFFSDYLIKGKNINYKGHVNKVGYNYLGHLTKPYFDFGQFSIGWDERIDAFRFKNVGPNNFDCKEGDIIRTINKRDANDNQLKYVYESLMQPKSERPTFVTVLRAGEVIELHAQPNRSNKTYYYQVVNKEKPSEAQLFLKYNLFKKAG